MGLLDEIRPPVDALLLADFVHLRKQEWVIEFGSGNGAVLFRLAERYPGIISLGIEREKSLVHQACEIAHRHGHHALQIIAGDYRHPPLSEESVPVIVTNPPYRKPGTGKISPARGGARHELHGTINELIQSARIVLKPKGRLYLIHLAERAIDVFENLRASRIEPKRVIWCHHNGDASASLVLIEGRKGARPGLIVEPPILIDDFQRKETSKA